jgi:hypothetical protein
MLIHLRSIILHWALETGARQSQFRAYGVSAAYASVTQSISDYNVRLAHPPTGIARYFFNPAFFHSSTSKIN